MFLLRVPPQLGLPTLSEYVAEMVFLSMLIFYVEMQIKYKDVALKQEKLISTLSSELVSYRI